LEFAKTKLGVEVVATGHYARIKQVSSSSSLPSNEKSSSSINSEEEGEESGEESRKFQLLKGVDDTKDQSYFLASIHPNTLSSVLFPLGEYKKSDVREIAAKYNLIPAEKRSSAGICFIGRRNFAEFLEQYLPIAPGRFIDVESGKDVGQCENILTVTVGQRPGIGGASDRTYVVGKDINKGVVYIATGRNHPALETKSAMLRTPHWLSEEHFDKLKRDGELQCEYKARYGQPTAKCTLQLVYSEENAAEKGFRTSKFCGLQAEDSKIDEGYVLVGFNEPAGAITPQQEFVMYDGDVCIGSAAIGMPGQTLYEERRAET
jgi:tRNA-specific 2-thiouridylase